MLEQLKEKLEKKPNISPFVKLKQSIIDPFGLGFVLQINLSIYVMNHSLFEV